VKSCVEFLLEINWKFTSRCMRKFVKPEVDYRDDDDYYDFYIK